MKITCPGCQDPSATVKREGPFFPFCSERCRNGDLQKWLEEGYSVPGPPVGPGDIEPGQFDDTRFDPNDIGDDFGIGNLGN